MVASALLALLLLSQAASPAAAVASFQGTWTISTVNGQAVADLGKKMSLTFTGDRYSQTTDGQVMERGTFKIDASKKPMTIDMRITEGVAVGETQIGVVQVVGDTLTLKTNTVGTPLRPTDFKPQVWYVLIVAKKAR